MAGIHVSFSTALIEHGPSPDAHDKRIRNGHRARKKIDERASECRTEERNLLMFFE
jgi:hypothetical protein